MKLRIKKQYYFWTAIIVLLVGLSAIAYIFRQPISKIASENWLATMENNVENIFDSEKKDDIVTLNEDVFSETKNPSKYIYEETAQKGEGITHLARRAMNKYLKETNREENLTKEHKVYIEDYLQNKRGERWLVLGEKMSFSGQEIEEAIQKSLKLSQDQLENLKQFTTFLE